ncbi:50S ribosomal protein L30 [Hydrogenibacillus sp. N12]|uniref:50S ribosomal protein L30 n=1 Tax=Hydrogenibacillus sp. N12 TaxID=2866627 RepID=UPI001C7D9EBF|nr:50S ribosomal protein L30 [Hydrogenibacillus sp. N12]QZA33141.1 50S ribosomal protein L30 [Hydrogenibacillus sp. N12]
MAKIVVTLKRSPIGRPEDQKRTVRALGLRKLHQSVVHDDTPSIRGMIAKVAHLVEVRPAEAATEEAAKGGQSR